MQKKICESVSECAVRSLPDQVIQHEGEMRKRRPESDGVSCETMLEIFQGKIKVPVRNNVINIIPVHLESVEQGRGEDGERENKEKQFRAMRIQKTFDMIHHERSSDGADGARILSHLF